MGLKEETIIKIIEECIKPLSGLKNGFEKQENRADEIAENLPPEKYPSVSAVIAFVKNKIEVFSEAVGKVYLKATDFEDYKTDASNTYAKKTDVEDFENNVADTYATKTDVEDFENNVADTYATKTDVENFENNVADTYATKTDVEDFENNVADTYATKTDVEDFENNVAETYATKTDVEDFENNVADTYATKTDVEDLKTDTEVIATATGKAITINPANAPIPQLILRGEIIQDGTPTPDNPIELKSVGDSGSFEVGVYGGNLLNHNVTTQTKDGVTITVNSDKSITVNGTAENAISLNLFGYQRNNLGGLWLSGCAVGGAWGKYCLAVHLYDDKQAYIGNTCDVGYGTQIPQSYICMIVLEIGKGTTVNNLTFYPMVSTTRCEYEPYKAKQTLTMPYTLRSDKSGITDEIDLTRGVHIQRAKVFSLAVADMNNTEDFAGWKNLDCVGDLGNVFPKNYSADVSCLSNVSTIIGYNTNGQNTLFFSKKIFGLTQSQWKSQYPDLVVKVILPLITPIETELTETELNAYRHLMTNKGNTTILSEADMEVDYYINKPNAQAIGNIHSQVNADYFKLSQAIISVGGN